MISSTEAGRNEMSKLGSNKRMLENRKNGITPKRGKVKEGIFVIPSNIGESIQHLINSNLTFRLLETVNIQSDSDVIMDMTRKRLIEILGRGHLGTQTIDYSTLTTTKATRVNLTKVSSSGTKFSLLSSLWLESQLSSPSNLISLINAILDNNYPNIVSKKLDFIKSFDRGCTVLDSFFKSQSADLKTHRKVFASVRRLTDVNKSKLIHLELHGNHLCLNRDQRNQIQCLSIHRIFYTRASM